LGFFFSSSPCWKPCVRVFLLLSSIIWGTCWLPEMGVNFLGFCLKIPLLYTYWVYLYIYICHIYLSIIHLSIYLSIIFLSIIYRQFSASSAKLQASS
jgi:hypothetical protein